MSLSSNVRVGSAYSVRGDGKHLIRPRRRAFHPFLPAGPQSVPIAGAAAQSGVGRARTLWLYPDGASRISLYLGAVARARVATARKALVPVVGSSM